MTGFRLGDRGPAVAEVRAELRDVARHDTRVYDLAAVTAWGPDGRPCWGDPRFGTLQAVRDYVGSGTGVRDADPFAAEVGAGLGVHTRGAVLHLASMRVQPAPYATCTFDACRAGQGAAEKLGPKARLSPVADVGPSRISRLA